MVEVLKQKNGEPIPLEKQVAAIYAANQKFFRDVPVAKVTTVERAFTEFLDSNFSSLLAGIKKSGQLSDDAKKELGKSMEEFRLLTTFYSLLSARYGQPKINQIKDSLVQKDGHGNARHGGCLGGQNAQVAGACTLRPCVCRGGALGARATFGPGRRQSSPAYA